jgi:uncharacterized protein (DUF433 family)
MGAPVAEQEGGALGSGLYSLSELSRYLSVPLIAPAPKVLRWIKDGLTPSAHQRGQPTYGFHDLISLLVVGSLRESGVKLSAVRQAEAYLRDERRIPRPFATEDIYTDGVNVLFNANPSIAGQLTAANRRGQEVWRDALRGLLRQVWYKDGLAIAWDVRDRVRIDPRVQFGEPCVAGTRIPTAQVHALASAGDDEARLAELYEVPVEAVTEAIDFEERVARAA